jgi:hypothetical protein
MKKEYFVYGTPITPWQVFVIADPHCCANQQNKSEREVEERSLLYLHNKRCWAFSKNHQNEHFPLSPTRILKPKKYSLWQY